MKAPLWPSSFRFLIRTRLDAGTYYVEVEGYSDDDIGFYNLHVNKVTEPGNTTADAAPLLLGKAGGGRNQPINRCGLLPPRYPRNHEHRRGGP